ncbi:MAG TPA: universal stress protein [bacterium]|nr:universal stress protein [bacterium]
MMKSILVALDGSPASLTGLKEAARWAEILGAELRGAFVEDEQRFVYYPAGFSAEGGVPVAAPLPEEDMAAENEKVRKEGVEIRQAFEAAVKGKSLRTEFIQVRGNVNQILTREARAADLVVMGRRGRNDPVDSTEAGPTTETLIHSALRPVLVVPEKFSGDGTFVFAYDGSKGAQRVVAAGTELAAAVKGKVSVLSIGDDPQLKRDQEEVLKRYWRPYGLDTKLNVAKREGKASTMIVDFARQQNAGMIVMGAFGHNPLRELFFGSTTLEVLAETGCPVLLMA